MASTVDRMMNEAMKLRAAVTKCLVDSAMCGVLQELGTPETCKLIVTQLEIGFFVMISAIFVIF